MVVLIMLIGAGLVYWAVGQLYARYWNKGLSVEIRFSSDHAVKGDEIELIETVANRKYLPLPYIYVKFQTDKSLFFLGKDGSNAVSDKAYRNDVFSLMNYQQAVRRIPLRCTKRGIYRIRNVQIVSTGAFMGDVLAAESAQDAVITVYPKTADTDRLAVPFFQMMGTVERNKYLYEDHFMFRGIREYQSYDSMNQVNWTATAKSGQLMVNQYNESTCQQVCILLNVEPEGMIPKEKLSEERSRKLFAGLLNGGGVDSPSGRVLHSLKAIKHDIHCLIDTLERAGHAVRKYELRLDKGHRPPPFREPALRLDPALPQCFFPCFALAASFFSCSTFISIAAIMNACVYGSMSRKTFGGHLNLWRQ